jgi:hypothetical protein
MEHSGDEDLTKAQPEGGSRRTVLGVLAALSALAAGSLLVAPGADEAEATNKRRGRKRSHRPGQQKQRRQMRRRLERKRQKRKRQKGEDPNGFILRGHSVYLNNPKTASKHVVIEGTETQYLGLCKLLGKIDLVPGQDALFDSHNTTLELTINRHFSFQFINGVFSRPRVVAGTWGSSDLCPTTYVRQFEASFSEGDVMTVTLDGKNFTVRRNDDKSDFKYWSLEFPPDL